MSRKPTLADLCEQIVRAMLDRANELPEGETVALEHDWGDFTATVWIGGAHTHVGVPGKDGSWELFVRNLHSALTGGPGLSFYRPAEKL